MSKICAVCKKGNLAGRNIQHKQTGGWAFKAPRTIRKLSPNLRKIKVYSISGGSSQIKVCMKCYKKINRA